MKLRSKKVKITRTVEFNDYTFHETLACCMGCENLYATPPVPPPQGPNDEPFLSCTKTMEILSTKKTLISIGEHCPLEDFKIEHCICLEYECQYAVSSTRDGRPRYLCLLGKNPKSIPVELGLLTAEKIPIPDTCLLDDWVDSDNGGQHEAKK